MTVAIALAIALAICSVAPADAHTSRLQLQPVSELNVTQYLGRWYQMYGDALTQGTFEIGAVCVVATYGLFPNGTVSVFNSERETDPVHGEPRNITGYATVPDRSQPGKLEVHLDGVPVAAPYWVFLLGPVIDGLYDAYVTGWLSSNGWTGLLNKPIPTLQVGCVYP